METKRVMCPACLYGWLAAKHTETPVNMCQCPRCGQQGKTLDVSVAVFAGIQ